MIELIVGALLAGGAVWFVLQPIFRSDGGRGTGERGRVKTPDSPRRCEHCGAPLERDAIFCSACGRRVEGGAR